MPQRITKYRTVDGTEHETWDGAYAHEQALKLVADVYNVIVDSLNAYTDDQKRRVYTMDQASVNAIADMMVNTDLLSIINKVTKGKVKQ